MLAGLLWEAFWTTAIAFGGAQGTVPLLAFVGGLLAIAGALAYLSWEEEQRQEQVRRRLLEVRDLLSETRRNGHSPYSRTWPATRTQPWQRRVP
jgi:hypothetical protein